MTTIHRSVPSSLYGPGNAAITAEQIKAYINTPGRTAAEIQSEAEANGVSVEQISKAMEGNKSFSAQSISSYLASQGTKSPPRSVSKSATAPSSAAAPSPASAATTLFGAGNPEISDTEIQDYINQPGRTPEDVLAGALANGLSAAQIARAMAGHPDYTLANITQNLAAQGIASTGPHADPLDFRAEILFGAGNPAISAAQIQQVVNQPGATSEQILAAALEHGISAEQLAAAFPDRPEFSLDNITNYIESQGIATQRDPSRYANLQGSVLYGAGNAAISDTEIQAYINQPGRSEEQILHAALANGVSLAQIAKAMDGNPAFTLANLNDVVGFKQDLSSLEVLMSEQAQLLKELDAASGSQATDAASQKAMDALRASLAQLEPQLEAARAKVDERIAAGQAQDAIAAQAENAAAELKAQFDTLQLERLHAQAKIDEQQGAIDAAQAEINAAQAALDTANQDIANAAGIHKKSRRHRARGEAQAVAAAAQTALSAAQQKLATLQPGLAQAQADAAPAFAAAQAMQTQWQAAQSIADGERAKAGVLFGGAQRAVQLEVALKQALSSDQLQLIDRSQTKAGQLQKQIDAGELTGSARTEALKSIALDASEAAELVQKIDAQATEDRLRESALAQAAVPAQTQAYGAQLIAENLLGDATKLDDANTQVGAELSQAKGELDAAAQRLLAAKIALSKADFAVDWDQAKKDPTKSSKAVAVDQPLLDAASAELEAAQTAFDALQAKVSSLQHLATPLGEARLDAVYAAGSAVQRANVAATQANAATGWAQLAQARYESSDQLLAASQAELIQSTRAAAGTEGTPEANSWADQYTTLVSDARTAAQATRAEQRTQNALAVQAGGAQILSVFLKDKVAHASEVYAQAQAQLAVQQEDFQNAAAHSGELAPAADQARQELADADLNAAFAFAVGRSKLSPEQLSAAEADKAGFVQTWQDAEMAKRTDARKQIHLLDDLAQVQKNDPACQAARQHALDTGNALEQASQSAIDAGDIVQGHLIVAGLLGQSVLDDQAQLAQANAAAAELSTQVGQHALVLGQSAQAEVTALDTFSQGLASIPAGVPAADAYAPQIESAQRTAELSGQIAAQMPQSSADWLQAADAWKAQAATEASTLETLKTQLVAEQTARDELGQKIQASYTEQVQVHGFAVGVLKTYGDRDDHIKELHEDRKLMDDAHKRFKKSQMMKMILKIGIAVVISALAMWAGPLLGAMLLGVEALGTVGTAVAVGAGAAAGSAVSQGISIGAGLQDKFSMAEVALSGLSAGLTVGALGSVVGQTMTRGVLGAMIRVGLVEAVAEGALVVPTLAQSIAKNVAIGITGGAINTGVQGAMTAVGLQNKMDWGQVAAVGLAMGLSSATQGFANSFKVGTGPSVFNSVVDTVHSSFTSVFGTLIAAPTLGGSTPVWQSAMGSLNLSIGGGGAGVHMDVPEGVNVASNQHFVDHPFAAKAGSETNLYMPGSIPRQPAPEFNVGSYIGDAVHYVGTGIQSLGTAGGGALVKLGFNGAPDVRDTFSQLPPSGPSLTRQATEALTNGFGHMQTGVGQLRAAVGTGVTQAVRALNETGAKLSANVVEPVGNAIAGAAAAASGVLTSVELPGVITRPASAAWDGVSNSTAGTVVKGVAGHAANIATTAFNLVDGAVGPATNKLGQQFDSAKATVSDWLRPVADSQVVANLKEIGAAPGRLTDTVQAALASHPLIAVGDVFLAVDGHVVSVNPSSVNEPGLRNVTGNHPAIGLNGGTVYEIANAPDKMLLVTQDGTYLMSKGTFERAANAAGQSEVNLRLLMADAVEKTNGTIKEIGKALVDGGNALADKGSALTNQFMKLVGLDGGVVEAAVVGRQGGETSNSQGGLDPFSPKGTLSDMLDEFRNDNVSSSNFPGAVRGSSADPLASNGIHVASLDDGAPILAQAGKTVQMVQNPDGSRRPVLDTEMVVGNPQATGPNAGKDVVILKEDLGKYLFTGEKSLNDAPLVIDVPVVEPRSSIDAPSLNANTLELKLAEIDRSFAQDNLPGIHVAGGTPDIQQGGIIPKLMPEDKAVLGEYGYTVKPVTHGDKTIYEVRQANGNYITSRDLDAAGVNRLLASLVTLKRSGVLPETLSLQMDSTQPIVLDAKEVVAHVDDSGNVTHYTVNGQRMTVDQFKGDRLARLDAGETSAATDLAARVTYTDPATGLNYIKVMVKGEKLYLPVSTNESSNSNGQYMITEGGILKQVDEKYRVVRYKDGELRAVSNDGNLTAWMDGKEPEGFRVITLPTTIQKAPAAIGPRSSLPLDDVAQASYEDRVFQALTDGYIEPPKLTSNDFFLNSVAHAGHTDVPTTKIPGSVDLTNSGPSHTPAAALTQPQHVLFDPLTSEQHTFSPNISKEQNVQNKKLIEKYLSEDPVNDVSLPENLYVDEQIIEGQLWRVVVDSDTENVLYMAHGRNPIAEKILTAEEYIRLEAYTEYLQGRETPPAPEWFEKQGAQSRNLLQENTAGDAVHLIFARYTGNGPGEAFWSGDLSARRQIERLEAANKPFEIERKNLIIGEMDAAITKDQGGEKYNKQKEALLSDLRELSKNPAGRKLLEMIQDAPHPVIFHPGSDNRSHTSDINFIDPDSSNGIGVPTQVWGGVKEAPQLPLPDIGRQWVAATRISAVAHEAAHAYLSAVGRQPGRRWQQEMAAIQIENAVRYWSGRPLRSLDYHPVRGLPPVNQFGPPGQPMPQSSLQPNSIVDDGTQKVTLASREGGIEPSSHALEASFADQAHQTLIDEYSAQLENPPEKGSIHFASLATADAGDAWNNIASATSPAKTRVAENTVPEITDPTNNLVVENVPLFLKSVEKMIGISDIPNIPGALGLDVLASFPTEWAGISVKTPAQQKLANDRKALVNVFSSPGKWPELVKASMTAGFPANFAEKYARGYLQDLAQANQAVGYVGEALSNLVSSGTMDRYVNDWNAFAQSMAGKLNQASDFAGKLAQGDPQAVKTTVGTMGMTVGAVLSMGRNPHVSMAELVGKKTSADVVKSGGGRTFDFSHLDNTFRKNGYELTREYGTLDKFTDAVIAEVAKGGSSEQKLVSMIGLKPTKKMITAIENDPAIRTAGRSPELIRPHVANILRDAWEHEFIGNSPFHFTDAAGKQISIKTGWRPYGENSGTRDATFAEVGNMINNAWDSGTDVKNMFVYVDGSKVPMADVVNSHLNNLLVNGGYSAKEVQNFFMRSNGMAHIDEARTIKTRLDDLIKYEGLPTAQGPNFTAYRRDGDVVIDFRGQGLSINPDATKLAAETQRLINDVADQFSSKVKINKVTVENDGVLVQKASDGITAQERRQLANDKGWEGYSPEIESLPAELAKYLVASGMKQVAGTKTYWLTPDGLRVDINRGTGIRYDPDTGKAISWPNPISVSIPEAAPPLASVPAHLGKSADGRNIRNMPELADDGMGMGRSSSAGREPGFANADGAIQISETSHLQQNSRNILVRFKPGRQFNVSGDATTIIKRPKSVQNLTNPPIFLTREVKIDFTDRFVEVNDYLRDRLGSVVTTISSPRPGILSQTRVSGKSFEQLDPSVQSHAITQMNNLVSDANYSMGTSKDVPVPYERTPGYSVMVDDNRGNFMFNEQGEVTHWFDPVQMSVDYPDEILNNKGIRFDIEDVDTQIQKSIERSELEFSQKMRATKFRVEGFTALDDLKRAERDLRSELYEAGIDSDGLYDLVAPLKFGGREARLLDAGDIQQVGQQLLKDSTPAKIRELAHKLPQELQAATRTLADSIESAATRWASGPQI